MIIFCYVKIPCGWSEHRRLLLAIGFKWLHSRHTIQYVFIMLIIRQLLRGVIWLHDLQWTFLLGCPYLKIRIIRIVFPIEG